jgi:hypothetical protein
MKKTSEKFKYFLIILFSFWILIFPAYLYFSIVDDLDMVSLYTCIKNIDQEDSILNSEKKEMILTFLIKHILISRLPLVRISNLSNQLPTLNFKSLILRC